MMMDSETDLIQRLQITSDFFQQYDKLLVLITRIDRMARERVMR